ncbi:MAG: glycosyltransferase family 2 protein [Ruminococcaceae bacterium]|nr:glycosyltransferase family 2 protein [Oscillospiraceae bacterium]
MYSIIVPIYKVEEFLPQCIESVLAQTHKDFELILVDDGSPDGCPAICDEYAAKDSRIKVVHKENGGLVSARKAGLAIASGSYICFVDGDDFILPDMLEAFHRALDEDYDVLCANFFAYYNEDRIILTTHNVPTGCYDKAGLTSEIYPKMLSASGFFRFGIMPNLWTKCIKKELLAEAYRNMPDNISLGEDAAITYPVLLNAERILVLDYSGYMYRQNPLSMTRTTDKKLFNKIQNLVVHLKNVEKTTGWQVGNQMNKYIVFLMLLAKNNEFKFNQEDCYRTKANNLKRYLNEPIVKEALKNVKLSGLKNKFILFCFRHQFLLPFYLYEGLVKGQK